MKKNKKRGIPRPVEGIESANREIQSWPPWKQAALASIFGLTLSGMASPPANSQSAVVNRQISENN
jgi:hypothetical protein